MEYPKPVMTLKELSDLGFSMYLLRCATKCKYANRFVTRNTRGGKIFIITKEFEKVRAKGVFEL